jgi:hypothetical protein
MSAMAKPDTPGNGTDGTAPDPRKFGDRIIAFMEADDERVAEREAIEAVEREADDQYANEPRIETAPISSVAAKPIVPLLPGILYKGKVTVIAGLPGDGKSLLSTDIAARISAGAARPLGNGCFDQNRVLLLTAEDDPADTIRPRLDVARADPDLVLLVKGVSHIDARTGARTLDTVRLMADLPLIEQRIEHLKAALFIIDPLTSFAGSDTEKTGEMRLLLDALGQMAARTGIAILIITHLNKRSDARRAMQMISGSHVIVAAVRVVLVTSRDPNDKHRRLLLPIKLNIAKDDGGFAFTVTGKSHATCGDIPAVTWESDRVTDLSADDALIDSTPRAQAAVEKSIEVQDWLRDLLRMEPVAAATLWRQAKDKGYSDRRVRDALKAIKAKCDVMGYQGKWHYRLPPAAPESDTEARRV